MYSKPQHAAWTSSECALIQFAPNLIPLLFPCGGYESYAQGNILKDNTLYKEKKKKKHMGSGSVYLQLNKNSRTLILKYFIS